ncbi:hypothetical protein BGX38DRAFT_1233061 [Terfezia claveryi]|nr:hypothetical protein BGX38DRAFT_1233061 [Terfezia claveryi]
MIPVHPELTSFWLWEIIRSARDTYIRRERLRKQKLTDNRLAELELAVKAEGDQRKKLESMVEGLALKKADAQGVREALQDIDSKLEDAMATVTNVVSTADRARDMATDAQRRVQAAENFAEDAALSIVDAAKAAEAYTDDRFRQAIQYTDDKVVAANDYTKEQVAQLTKTVAENSDSLRQAINHDIASLFKHYMGPR